MLFVTLLEFLGLAIAVVLVTRFLLLGGLERASKGFGFSTKAQGQLMGYATSAPELVGTCATASRGLLGAGLWNVAASNIINLGLFGVAVVTYHRTGALRQRKFLDEMGFALSAIALPLLLTLRRDWAESPWTAAGLLGCFALYLLLDWRLNAEPGPAESAPRDLDPALGRQGIVLILLGIAGVIVSGHFLGIVAEDLVVALKIPEAAVGWVLGVVTSLPEMTSFFVVFAASSGLDDEDCQRNLDNLAASNMSNMGLVYPIGIVLFILFAGPLA